MSDNLYSWNVHKEILKLPTGMFLKALVCQSQVDEISLFLTVNILKLHHPYTIYQEQHKHHLQMSSYSSEYYYPVNENDQFFISELRNAIQLWQLIPAEDLDAFGSQRLFADTNTGFSKWSYFTLQVSQHPLKNSASTTMFINSS